MKYIFRFGCFFSPILFHFSPRDILAYFYTLNRSYLGECTGDLFPRRILYILFLHMNVNSSLEVHVVGDLSKRENKVSTFLH